MQCDQKHSKRRYHHVRIVLRTLLSCILMVMSVACLAISLPLPVLKPPLTSFTRTARNVTQELASLEWGSQHKNWHPRLHTLPAHLSKKAGFQDVFPSTAERAEEWLRGGWGPRVGLVPDSGPNSLDQCWANGQSCCYWNKAGDGPVSWDNISADPGHDGTPPCWAQCLARLDESPWIMLTGDSNFRHAFEMLLCLLKRGGAQPVEVMAPTFGGKTSDVKYKRDRAVLLEIPLSGTGVKRRIRIDFRFMSDPLLRIHALSQNWTTMRGNSRSHFTNPEPGSSFDRGGTPHALIATQGLWCLEAPDCFDIIRTRLSMSPVPCSQGFCDFNATFVERMKQYHTNLPFLRWATIPKNPMDGEKYRPDYEHTMAVAKEYDLPVVDIWALTEAAQRLKYSFSSRHYDARVVYAALKIWMGDLCPQCRDKPSNKPSQEGFHEV